MGEAAQVMGVNPVGLTEGDAFHKSALDVILYSVARVLLDQKKRAEYEKVSLALDLTFANYQFKQFYAEEIKGKKFVVEILDPEDMSMSKFTSISFEIEKLYILYQGYAAFFDHIIDDQGISKEYERLEGFVVDIGRKTTDMVYIKNLAVRDGDSEAFGVLDILRSTQKVLQQQGVVKDIEQIENFFLTGRHIQKLDGSTVDVRKIVYEQSRTFYGQFVQRFRSFLEQRTPDFFLVVGGGSYFVKEHLLEDYPIAEILEEPVYANARGMLRFVEAVS
jgi:hypothetical protein